MHYSRQQQHQHQQWQQTYSLKIITKSFHIKPPLVMSLLQISCSVNFLPTLSCNPKQTKAKIEKQISPIGLMPRSSIYQKMQSSSKIESDTRHGSLTKINTFFLNPKGIYLIQSFFKILSKALLMREKTKNSTYKTEIDDEWMNPHNPPTIIRFSYKHT